MKPKSVFLILLVFIAGKTFSQSVLNEFIIEIDNCPQAFYKSYGCTPNDGVIVINTTIANLKITMPDTPHRLKNTPTFDRDNNCYVLCVQPTDTEWGGITKYTIDIVAAGYKKGQIPVEEVRASVVKCFKVNPKIVDNTVEVTVSGKDGNPLTSTRVGIKGTDYEARTDNKGVCKVELPSANAATLVISHRLYSDTTEIIVRPGDRQTVHFYHLKPVTQTTTVVYKPRKPLIEDWSKDFKIIFGLSNGIVAGEIFGLYGEIKFGERTGLALEGGLGFGKYDSNRWSAGIKGYYKHWFLSTHYGTTTSIVNINKTFSMNDDGTFILAGNRLNGRYGITELVGYDRCFGWFHLTTGIGGTVTTTVKPKFIFAWNIGIGISLMDLIYKLDY